MPERQRILLPRIGQQHLEQRLALLGRDLRKIKFRQSIAEGRRGVLKVRRTWPNLGTRSTDCASGDERLVAIQLEANPAHRRSEEHTSELQSRLHLVCRLLLEKKNQS